jgi:hypothetical protein
MAEPRKIPVVLPDGRTAQGVEIQVDTSNERWSEYTLQDGTVFRGKLNIISVVRVEGEFDPQGQPVYQINAGPFLAFVEIPEKLKQQGKH